jgi:hypothetical protein
MSPRGLSRSTDPQRYLLLMSFNCSIIIAISKFHRLSQVKHQGRTSPQALPGTMSTRSVSHQRSSSLLGCSFESFLGSNSALWSQLVFVTLGGVGARGQSQQPVRFHEFAAARGLLSYDNPSTRWQNRGEVVELPVRFVRLDCLWAACGSQPYPF